MSLSRPCVPLPAAMRPVETASGAGSRLDSRVCYSRQGPLGRVDRRVDDKPPAKLLQEQPNQPHSVIVVMTSGLIDTVTALPTLSAESIGSRFGSTTAIV